MKTFRDLTITGATPALRRGVRHLIHLMLTLERAPYDTRLHLHFVSLSHMHQLNYKNKGLDRPTDVLTFTHTGEVGNFMNDLLFGDDLGGEAEGAGPTLAALSMRDVAVEAAPSAMARSAIRADLVDLGDIFVSLDYILLRCNRCPSTTLPPVPYLHAAIVHATLHALGYDHNTPGLLRHMVQKEQQLGRQIATIARQHARFLPPLDMWELM
ncbi:hypothetical protein JKF63_01896 [Porcisia hertigi]|uniref:Uncharacterized protein n=1 Tax=Porcisia hertigi TaxID=2761500 RepID=A0A836L1S6_9TRYP|nr:hypothetical protein JKF63_01896 [Porcisia hertigi]